MKKYSLRVPVTAALLAALSIVLGKFAAISIGDTIRISFENLPLILSSVILGPLWGLGTAVCADLLGCVLRGYGIIPLITFAQAMMGLVPGLLTRIVFRRTSAGAVAVSAMLSHVICSMGIKTAALHFSYGSPFLPLLGSRVLLYLGIGAAEAYICALLVRNSAVRREFSLPDAPCRRETSDNTAKKSQTEALHDGKETDSK